MVFGDSLSDTGNLLRLYGVPNATFYRAGRFADNGNNWVDVLQAAYPNLTVLNYAQGGATLCKSLAFTTFTKLYSRAKYGLLDQVALYMADLADPGSEAAKAAARSGRGKTAAIIWCDRVGVLC